MDSRMVDGQLELPLFVSMSEAERVTGLREQHRAPELSRYDGHNRRPIASSAKHLGHRRRRRRVRASLRAVAA